MLRVGKDGGRLGVTAPRQVAVHRQEVYELAEGEAFPEKPFSATGLREAARLVLFDRLNPWPQTGNHTRQCRNPDITVGPPAILLNITSRGSRPPAGLAIGAVLARKCA